MKITIESTEPDEERKLHLMLKAEKMQRAFYEISQEIFRPARKHGYVDDKIREHLHDKLPEKEHGERCDLIGALETKFYEILSENGIDVDD